MLCVNSQNYWQRRVSKFIDSGRRVELLIFALRSHFEVEFEAGRGVRVVYGAALEIYQRLFLRVLLRLSVHLCVFRRELVLKLEYFLVATSSFQFNAKLTPNSIFGSEST